MIRHVTMTRAEYRAYADAEAHRMLGVSYDEAIQQLDAGALHGTLAEARLSLMRSMLGAADADR